MKVKGLLNVVNQVMSGCKTNDTDNKNILFKDGSIYSWSPAISVSAKLPSDCADLKGVVSGFNLSVLLSRLDVEDVNVVCESNKWVFSTDSMEAELLSTDNHDIEEKVAKLGDDAREWKTLPTNFYDCLAICDIPNNNRDSKISGVYMNGDMMLSTDNLRVNRAKLNGTFDTAVLMSPYSVAEVRHLPIQFTEYAVTQRWVHFRKVEEGTDLLVFSCNRYDETVYMNDRYSQLVDMALSCKAVEGTLPNMSRVVLRAQTFDDCFNSEKSELLNNIITLKFEKRKMSVCSQRGTSGRFSEKLSYPDDVTLDIASPMSVRISAPFLLTALQNTRKFALSSVGKHTLMVLMGDYFTTIIQVFEG